MHSSLQASPVEPVDLLTTEQLKSAWLRGETVEFGDPALARTSMPFRATFFPAGFAVTLSSNSADVLDAATRSWGTFKKLFETEPLEIKIGVSATESEECPPTPVCRVRDHISTNIADGENFAVQDHSQGYSLVWVTTAALRHGEYFRYFFLDSTAMSAIAARYALGVHAACVTWDKAGILLCGESGAGKSTLAYACARAGWTYVTDDGSFLVNGRDDRLVVGNSALVRFRPTARALFPELCELNVMERAGVGKPSIELATEKLPSFKTSNTATVRQIVFLKRGGPVQELAVFPTAVARHYMLQQVHSMPYLAALKLETVDHLLQLGAWELRYNDLDWATERLELLAREGQ